MTPDDNWDSDDVNEKILADLELGPAERNYAVVKVFFATDRGRTGSDELAHVYGTTRGELSYGTCKESIPRDHRMGELEAPSIWRLQFRKDPEKHVVLLDVSTRKRARYFQDLASRIAASARKQAFIFVHGYNVSFEDAARRTAQIAYDLGFDGAPMFYSWPSAGKALGYPSDEDNVDWGQSI